MLIRGDWLSLNARGRPSHYSLYSQENVLQRKKWTRRRAQQQISKRSKKETDRAPKKRFFQPGLGRLHKFLQTNHGNAGAIQGVRKKMHALTG